MTTNVRSLDSVQSIAPDNPSDQITLPSPTYSGQSVWLEFADVAAEFELCFGSSDTEGIRVTTDGGVFGPFQLATAPSYAYAGSATTARVTVLLN